jgi:hypothetical protein
VKGPAPEVIANAPSGERIETVPEIGLVPLLQSARTTVVSTETPPG